MFKVGCDIAIEKKKQLQVNLKIKRVSMLVRVLIFIDSLIHCNLVLPRLSLFALKGISSKFRLLIYEQDWRPFYGTMQTV